jgi:hypothetical protein
MSLTSYETLNTENIRFSETFKGTYKTIIPIGIKDEEENIIPLILNTPSNLLTFGIQEINDKNKNNIIGYQLPICLWGKKKVTNEEKIFTKKMEEVIEYIKEFLLSIKEEINVTDEMIHNLNILNWKYENGVKCEDKGPILYAKLITKNQNQNQRITTTFIDEKSTNELDPFDIMNKRGTVTSAIRIENIIIGNRIKVQVKLVEVFYKKIEPNVYEKKDYIKKSLLKPEIQIKKTTQSQNRFASLELDD